MIKETAKAIADWLTEVGTQNTMSGNYHVEFDEVNEKFDIDLPEDEELLAEILDSFDYDVVAEVDAFCDFDMMFYLAYCPNAEDEWEETIYEWPLRKDT